jgi:hypothetical protein
MLAYLKESTHRHPLRVWLIAGLILALPLFALSTLSSSFDYGISDKDKPVITLVALLMGAGVIYLLIISFLEETQFNRALLIWIVLLGLSLRLGMFWTIPMLEDDHFRYLWDGGMLANGFNPYEYTPEEFQDATSLTDSDTLHRLAQQAEPILKWINYPWLRTIYPPVSQGAFALAHLIRPWSLIAWRCVLLALDLTVLLILYHILTGLNRPLIGLVIYWWNPLLIKEIYNSAHMDVLIFPFLLGAILLSFKGRYVMASLMLGLAVGTKFWPVILLPVILRPVFGDWRRLIPAALVFAGVCFVMFLPFYLSGLDATSGFTAYRRDWEMNDSLFMFILWTVEFGMEIFGAGAWHAQGVARIIVFFLIVMWALWSIRRDTTDPLEIFRRCLLVIGALFLLSPTQYPWYYLWLLPFLTIYQVFPLLLLTALLPLYYLRFYLTERAMTQFHDLGIVWLEFVPVWSLLLLQWYSSRRKRPINA